MILEKPKKNGERDKQILGRRAVSALNPVSSPGFACFSQHQRMPESTRLPMFFVPKHKEATRGCGQHKAAPRGSV